MVKIEVDAPKSMIEFAKSSEAAERPYDICLHCPFIGISCDGPNVLSLEYKRWVDWALDWMGIRGLTRGEVALQAGIPLSTVKSALSGEGYDIRAETKRAITKVLIGGCFGQYPCHFAALLMAGEAQEAEADHVTATERERMAEQMLLLKQEYQAKVDYLKERVEYLQTQVEHWQGEARIRDKYLEERNKTIDRLMDKILDSK